MPIFTNYSLTGYYKFPNYRINPFIGIIPNIRLCFNVWNKKIPHLRDFVRFKNCDQLVDQVVISITRLIDVPICKVDTIAGSPVIEI